MDSIYYIKDHHISIPPTFLGLLNQQISLHNFQDLQLLEFYLM